MKEIFFTGKCGGIGISHVVRDCDLNETIGFYKNEYQIYYILDGERFFYQGNKSYRMDRGTITFIDKRQIPFTNVIGGKYHERILIEVDEKWLISMGKALELDLIGFFTNYHGVYRLEGEAPGGYGKKAEKDGGDDGTEKGLRACGGEKSPDLHHYFYDVWRRYKMRGVQYA